jgi:hypothetical protein
LPIVAPWFDVVLTIEHRRDLILCVIALDWHLEDRPPLFIGDYNCCPTRGNAFRSISRSDLSPPSLGFLFCLFDIGEFGALVVQYRDLSAFEVKEKARHPEKIPLHRNIIWELIVPHALLHPQPPCSEYQSPLAQIAIAHAFIVVDRSR